MPIKSPSSDEEFLLKPMNCPHHCEIYKSEQWSYRDLPKRYAEFGTVYRYEQSGELHGLTRVRSFTQDDAHIFCSQDQLVDEFEKVIDLVLYVFNTLGFDDYEVQISLKDKKDNDKYIGTEEMWNRAENAIIKATTSKKLKYTIEYGEAAFYGPKLDFMVKDALNRKWQLGTIQVDYNLPERFDLTFKNSQNKDERPVMIHRAPFGSLERFVAILIEHTAGIFPLWLTSNQIKLISVGEKHEKFAEKVLNDLEKAEIRASLDSRNETVGKKIRESEQNKVPFMGIIGDKEINNNSVSLRGNGGEEMGANQIKLISVGEKHEKFAEKVLNDLEKAEIRASLDSRNETVGKKIRESEQNKVPFMGIIGDKEINNNSVSLRGNGGEEMGEMNIDELINFIKKEEENSLIN